MKKIYMLLGAFTLLSSIQSNAQVGVGTPTPQAALDISSGTNGVLIPRVALTSKIISAPVVNPNGGAVADGTMVWNTSTLGTAPNNVVPGFYYWEGTTWKEVGSTVPSTSWGLLGNTATPANFIGTTNAQDFRIRANNTLRWTVANGSGQLQANTNGTQGVPQYSFANDPNTGMWNNGLDALTFSTNGVERFRVANGNQVYAMTAGTGALPFYSFLNDPDTGIWNSGTDALGFSTTGVERFRIPSANQVHAMTTGTAALPFYSFNGDPNTGIWNSGADLLGFSTNALERFRITNGYQVQGLTGGAVGAPFYSFSTAATSGMWSSANNILNFSTNGTERVRILANGRVTVNSAAPFATDQFSVYNSSAAVLSAVNGYSTAANGVGVYGQAEGDAGLALYGIADADNGAGTYGANFNLLGTGVIGSGNGAFDSFYLTSGSGGAFTGNTGIYGYSTAPGIGEVALFQDIADSQWNIGHWDGFGYYKIIGDGAVSTTVKDLNGQKVVMHCTETPENLFEDYGTGKLQNGRTTISIDPIFSKNIIVDERHPLKVFVQLEGDCKGVYVTNKSANSFEVVELQNGNSNTAFSYSIVATRGNETYVMESGQTRVARYDRRFEKAPELKKKQTRKPVKMKQTSN